MAISDVLHDAEKDLSVYLKQGHGGAFKERLKSLLEEMDAIRFLPGFDISFGPSPAKRTAQEIIDDFTSEDSVSEAFGRAGEAQPAPIAPTPDGILGTLVGVGSSSTVPKNPLKGYEEK